MNSRNFQRIPSVGLVLGSLLFLASMLAACNGGDGGSSILIPPDDGNQPEAEEVEANALAMVQEGRETFRYDTFGNESFWTGQLRLNEAIAGSANGGVGGGISPATALALGLKVDVNALDQGTKDALASGNVDLEDPAVTLALLQMDAVVGVKGTFDMAGQLSEVGITCALCHSDVDDSFAPGIGVRQDGFAARDLNVGAIIAAAPSVDPFATLLGVTPDTVRTVLNSWGPGKFDASLLLDGKAFRPDGKSGAVLIPPAYGLAGVNMHTWTGWGSVTHWNAFVAALEMQGQGTFYDPRLNDAARFPIAAMNGFASVKADPDLITEKLPALQVYQLSIRAPEPPDGSYDVAAAERGQALFNGKAQCSTCHVPPIFTEPGWNMHTPDEIGIDSFQAERGPEDAYRTAPLNGLWAHEKGGFYHDGRFASYGEVIDHYDNHFALALSNQEKSDLTEYLKSL